MKNKQRNATIVAGIVLDAVFGIVAGGIAGIPGAIIALNAFFPEVWKDFGAFISGIWETCKDFLQGWPPVVEFICLFGVCPGLIIGLCVGLAAGFIMLVFILLAKTRNRLQSVITKVIISVGITVFVSFLWGGIAGLVLGLIGGVMTGLLF